jgi:hypothetical protein
MVAQVRNCDGCAKLQAQLRERDRQVAEWIERGQAAEIERDRLQKELENERWHYAEALTAEGRADAENASLRRELAEAKQEQARWESVAEMAWKQKDESDAALFVKNFDAALAEARGQRRRMHGQHLPARPRRQQPPRPIPTPGRGEVRMYAPPLSLQRGRSHDATANQGRC